MWTERLGGKAFCSVSPARYAGSSFTCAERFAAQAHDLLVFWPIAHVDIAQVAIF